MADDWITECEGWVLDNQDVGVRGKRCWFGGSGQQIKGCEGGLVRVCI